MRIAIHVVTGYNVITLSLVFALLVQQAKLRTFVSRRPILTWRPCSRVPGDGNRYFGNLRVVSNADAANQLIDAWLAYREMVAQLLVKSLNLESPKHVLRPEFRGRHELVGTGWRYRTHGIGIDIVRKNGHGGIDFDFSVTPGRLYAHPDWWRLCIFMRRVVHDNHVDTSAFAELIARPNDFEDVVIAELEIRRPK